MDASRSIIVHGTRHDFAVSAEEDEQMGREDILRIEANEPRRLSPMHET